jgi:replicative DNA helicase
MSTHDQPQLLMPPHSIESEQSVLGGLLLENEAYDRIISIVTEGDFYISDHAIIFRAICDLLNKQQPADIVTVAEWLESHNLLTKIGGIKYVGELAMNTPSAANIERYASIVNDHALMRKMAHISTEISAKIYNRAGLDARQLLDFAQSRWMTVGESIAKQNITMRPVAQVLDSVLENLDALSNSPQHNDVTGLPTGLIDLDRMTTGAQPGELIVLAARPSMGKTSLALNIIENAAICSKSNVAFFSLEMINDQLGMRLLASVSRINQQRVKIARLNDDEWGEVANAAEKLRHTGIYLDEESNINVNEIRARSRRLHRECIGGLQLIVIDYLQLLAWPDNTRDEVAAYSAMTRALKLLAKELHLPIIVLSQLNRSLESRPNKRPVMSDLRGSGGIEQDADTILFIYRDQVYNPDSMDKGIAEIIIGKQRNGPIGTVHCAFIDYLMRFENLAMGGVVPSVEVIKQKNFNRQNSRGNFPRKNQVDDIEM